MPDLPMPRPTVPNRPFATFKILSFDIYGTLIDWEGGIIAGIKTLIPQIPPSSPHHGQFNDLDTNTSTRARLSQLFTGIEADVQSRNPSMRYPELLSIVYLNLATSLSIPMTTELKSSSVTFGNSIGTWSAFPDTVNAVLRLSQHYRLVPLSNVDRDSFSNSCAGPLQGKIPFWQIYTAEDIGSYKPDLNNFRYLLREVDGKDREEGGEGVEMGDMLHVAQSLYHDHKPAREMGMSSVWINRKGANMGNVDGAKVVHERGEVGYGWRYNTLGEFADDVEKEFAERGH